MINYTPRLDKAIKRAAWAHEQAKQHRKGTDIPYIIHPFSVMLIASNVTTDEDVLISCLLHDVLEDVDEMIYGESQLKEDFGNNVLSIVKDVTKDGTEADWYSRSQSYLSHLQNEASAEAVIVSAADKIHNLSSILIDYEAIGNDLWRRFSTKSAVDQLWWYESILSVIRQRNTPRDLIDTLNDQVELLRGNINAPQG